MPPLTPFQKRAEALRYDLVLTRVFLDTLAEDENFRLDDEAFGYLNYLTKRAKDVRVFINELLDEYNGAGRAGKE